MIVERPILFSAPMVRAIIEGRKMQTRRIAVKDTSVKWNLVVACELEEWKSRGVKIEDGEFYVNCSFNKFPQKLSNRYGKVGDRLWVKETSIVSPKGFGGVASDSDRFDSDGERRIVQYLATSPNRDGANNYKLKATPSIFMPRWASRILADIQGMRVEPLQDISEEDAIAEGIEPIQGGTHLWRNYSIRKDESDWVRNPIDSYRSLWESINGIGSWNANPLVRTITFKKVTKS